MGPLLGASLIRMDSTMPDLNNEQIEFVSHAVAEFISDQRATFMGEGKLLNAEQRTAVEQFFDNELLELARVVVLTDRRVKNPRLYVALKALGFHNLPDFSTMAAITFENVVVSHGALAGGTLFHELVHAEQYRQLGVARFAELFRFQSPRKSAYGFGRTVHDRPRLELDRFCFGVN